MIKYMLFLSKQISPGTVGHPRKITFKYIRILGTALLSGGECQARARARARGCVIRKLVIQESSPLNDHNNYSKLPIIALELKAPRKIFMDLK